MSRESIGELLSVPPCPGSMDELALASGVLVARGWMFQPGCRLDRLQAHVDGRPLGTLPFVARPDVDRAFAWATDARPAAFALEHALDGAEPARVDLVAFSGTRPVARLSHLVPSPADATLPEPPRALQERVSGVHVAAFRAQGLRMLTDLTDQMTRLGIPARGRLLDWGCGCGRVTRHVRTRLTDVSVVGCDIDAEAVGWCRDHLAGEFVRIDPMPPTPFTAGSVDVAIACSVLTHLTVPVQEAWLAEMRRLIAPGGHLLASTHGAYAFRLAEQGRAPAQGRSLWQRLVGGGGPRRLSGVDDTALDPALDGIAPPGYYRGVYQSREHTIAVCSRFFTVVDYVECGLNGHQDLVILRRPA